MADILDDSFHLEKPKSKNFFLTLFLFMCTGAWLFYLNPKLKRKKVYLGIFWYAWLSFINVFTVNEANIGLDFLEEFHNHSDIGVYSIFAGWGIYYIIGLVDWSALEHKKKQL